MFRIHITILFILHSTYSSAQNVDFVDLIFKCKDDLEFTKAALPSEEVKSNFYLLPETCLWRKDRFILTHYPLELDTASLLYLFSDSTLVRIISKKEKQNLINQASTSTSKKLKNSYRTIKLTDTFNKVNNSFVYQLTNPIYTQDSVYAFVDASIYSPNETDINFRQGYEAQILFIFKRTEKEWELFNSKTELFIW